MVKNPLGDARRVFLWILAGCLVAAALDVLQTYLQGQLVHDEPASWQSMVFQGGEWLFLGALTPIAYTLGRRFPLQRPQLLRALLVHTMGAALLCIGWALLGVLARRGLGTGWGPFGGELLSWTLTSVPWSFFMYFAVLGCMHAYAYYLEARERESQAATLSAQLSDARLNALVMQLQPHFLFNSLNAVMVLVRDQRTQLATRMLELLSDVLRQVLRGGQPHEIPLADELLFVQQYLALEQIRFSDRLAVRYQIEERLRKALVPRFILQPLVENAIRHGIADRIENALVEIGARADGTNLILWVQDNGTGNGRTINGAGVGLENTRQRLITMYGERASLALERSTDGGTIARIRLPLRFAPEA